MGAGAGKRARDRARSWPALRASPDPAGRASSRGARDRQRRWRSRSGANGCPRVGRDHRRGEGSVPGAARAAVFRSPHQRRRPLQREARRSPFFGLARAHSGRESPVMWALPSRSPSRSLFRVASGREKAARSGGRRPARATVANLVAEYKGAAHSPRRARARPVAPPVGNDAPPPHNRRSARAFRKGADGESAGGDTVTRGRSRRKGHRRAGEP